MALESLFLNLARGNRLKSYMGCELPEGEQPKYAKDYGYVEVRPECAVVDGEKTQQVKRNQTAVLVAACSITPRVYRVMAVYNPDLYEVASLPSMRMYEADSGVQVPGCTIRAYRDIDLQSLPWLVRLYLLP